MIRPRKTLRRGEPTPAEKQFARAVCFSRAKGLCHWCGRYVALEVGQLCHLKAKRRFGWMESEEQKHLWGCPDMPGRVGCHSKSHNAGGKPLPSKGIE